MDAMIQPSSLNLKHRVYTGDMLRRATKSAVHKLIKQLAAWCCLAVMMLVALPCNASSLASHAAPVAHAASCSACCPPVQHAAGKVCCEAHPQPAQMVDRQQADPPLLFAQPESRLTAFDGLLVCGNRSAATAASAKPPLRPILRI
jgi:hypothetical protein